MRERWPLDPDRPVIELADVTIGFGGKPVLRGVDLRIVPGQTTFVVGRSGSGKTVLLKLMMGLLRPDRGRVSLFGRDLAACAPVEVLALRERMGMVFQNYALFDSLPVERNVGFALLDHGHLPRRDVARLTRELIRVLGLTGSEHLRPGELSGGMRKRVGLARALIANPEVVLFDEPTTGLDPLMVEKVDELIALARAEYRITSVIVSHDLTSMRRLADRVAFLDGGTIAFQGSFDDFVASRHPAIVAFLDGDRSARPAYPAPPPIVAGAAPAVELIGVHKRFGDNQVLRGLDLAIHPGRITALIGASGSGKSVIMKHALGLLRPDRGQVRVFGEDIVALPDRALNRVRRRFGLVFQHAALLDWLSVGDNIAFPLHERGGLSRAEIRARVGEIAGTLQLGDLLRRTPGELSAGERKRVAIARAMVTRPEIIVYDEPTTGQDPVRTRDIDDAIASTQARSGITTIVISHDLASTFRIAHVIAVLHDGRIAAYGTPAEVLASPDPYVQHFLRAGGVAGPAS